MKTDPICGMGVEETTPWRAERDGQTFYFCSERCKDKFLMVPDGAGGRPGSRHTCCGGTNGGCGSAEKSSRHGAREHGTHEHHAHAPPPVASADGEKIIYTCPMHPEVEQDHPGNCPICGMALEPKTVTAEVDDSEARDM